MFHTFRESNTERFSIQWSMKSGSGWTKSNFSSDLLRLREILKKLRGWKRLEHLKWCPYSPWMLYIYNIYICYIHLHLGMKRSTRRWQSAFVAMRVRRQINPQEHYIHDENIRVYIYIMRILQKQNREI